jgi:formate-dependent nitrite reductase membrane component NrfD
MFKAIKRSFGFIANLSTILALSYLAFTLSNPENWAAVSIDILETWDGFLQIVIGWLAPLVEGGLGLFGMRTPVQ